MFILSVYKPPASPDASTSMCYARTRPERRIVSSRVRVVYCNQVLTSISMDEEPRLTKRERRELRKQERLQQAGSEKKRKQMTTWISVIVLVALVTAGIIWIVMSSKSNNTNTVQTSSDTVTINDTDWSVGSKDAKVTLIEYSDFQCPACGFYYPLTKQLIQNETGTLRFVYRNYPLRTLHKNAQLAAQAAEAAGLQNKFWEMHDDLFERQNDWSALGDPTDIFVSYAKDLGLDAQKFSADLTSSAVKQAINADISSGDAAHVDATPTFFLQGKKVDNPPSSFDGLKKLIDNAAASVK